MDILTVKQASVKWEISTRRITTLCRQGRIEGATKAAGVWILPVDIEKPHDARIKNRKYVNWRNKVNMISKDYKDNLKNLKGTFAVEGMEINKESLRNLERLSSGQATYSEIVEELKQKYMQRV